MIDERKRSNRRYVVMRWSNWDKKRCQWLVSEIMKIIDEIERQNPKTGRNKGVTQAIVKGREQNSFFLHLSQVFSN